MPNLELFVAKAEFKFVSESQPGEFKGLGAVFNNMDSHKDIILPGAFTESLAEHEAKGTLPGLYVEHSAFTGGDPLPVGVYHKMSQDDRGLNVEGELCALDTDHGRRIRDLMMKGALTGLSIAFGVPVGGARMGKKQGEPRRTLTTVKLHAVDIVRDPSNGAARISELKSAFRSHLPADVDEDQLDYDFHKAIDAFAAELRAARVAGTAFTRESMTLREVQKILREEFGLSHARASDIAERRFATLPRDEGSKQAPAISKSEAIMKMNAALADFSLS